MNETVTIGDHDSLHCPHCGDPNGMHHLAVHVAMRRNEDCDGIIVTVAGQETSVSTLADAQFKGRRDDIRIPFACEFCGAIGQLLIIQHKGRTLLRWEPLT